MTLSKATVLILKYKSSSKDIHKYFCAVEKHLLNHKTQTTMLYTISPCVNVDPIFGGKSNRHTRFMITKERVVGGKRKLLL